jgi:glycosyltransferase involved in cell wall biosynthesis
MKTKVAYVFNAFDRGGAELGLLFLLENNFFANTDLKLITLFKGSGKLSFPPAFKAVTLNNKARCRITEYPQLLISLLKYLFREKPDILILSLELSNFLGRFYKLINPRVKIITFEHNTAYRSRLTSWLMWLTSPVVSAVFYDNEATFLAMRENFIFKNRLPFFYVPLLGLPPPRLKASYTTQGPLKIISAGRLEPQKNHILLLKALLLLKDLPITLTIAGEGRLEKELKDFCTQHHLNNVHFLGFVTNWQALDVDVFISSSLYEGLAITVLEAMNSALPVIATNTGGVKFYGVHLRNMLKISLDVKELAQSIRLLFNHPELREQLGKKAALDANKLYGLDSSVTKIKQLNTLLFS